MEYEDEVGALLHSIGHGATLAIVHPDYLRLLDVEPGFEWADYTDLSLDGFEASGARAQPGNFDGD